MPQQHHHPCDQRRYGAPGERVVNLIGDRLDTKDWRSVGLQSLAALSVFRGSKVFHTQEHGGLSL